MTRSSGSFQRNSARFKAQPLVLVVCEDSKSSKTYFQEAAHHFRASARIEFAHYGRTDPLGVVQAAVARTRLFDHVYCVIDRDSHHLQNFTDALSLARANPKISVLTSHPCFEFWLLLHFGFSRSPYAPAGGMSAADRVIADLRTKPGMESYSKGSIKGVFSDLLPRLESACTFASRTLEEAELVSEPNPSTPLHKLIAQLKMLGSPQQI